LHQCRVWQKLPWTKDSKIPVLKTSTQIVDKYTSEQYQKRFDEMWSQCQKSESSRRESRGRRRGVNEEICPKCHHVKGKRRRSKSSDNYLKQSSKDISIPHHDRDQEEMEILKRYIRRNQEHDTNLSCHCPGYYPSYKSIYKDSSAMYSNRNSHYRLNF